MRPLTFVVGTGRAGSTALTRILHAHPDVLSLNELLAAVHGRAFPPGPVTGPEFWRILAEPQHVFDTAIRSGTAMPELLYHRRPGRFSAEREGIPALCLMPLPTLVESGAETDALFDELAAVVPSWPSRPVAGQWRALFDWLCVRFGRRVVVERSGFSLGHLPGLRATFPEARYVHLFRDGPDCALSMSRHPGYRTILLMHRISELTGVPVNEIRPEHRAGLPPELTALLEPRFDPRLVLDSDLPLTGFGALWSELVTDGQAELEKVTPAARTALRYETLLADPVGELTRLAEFAGFEPSPAWLAAGAARLDPARQGAARRQLDDAAYAALAGACEPGTAALAGR